MPGDGLTHGPRAMKKHGEGTTGAAGSSGIPCTMCYGLSRALPVNRAFLLPSPRDHLTRLGISVGRPGPHAFAVRLGAVRPHE